MVFDAVCNYINLLHGDIIPAKCPGPLDLSPLQYSRWCVLGSFNLSLMSKYLSAGLRPARLMCGRMWL